MAVMAMGGHRPVLRLSDRMRWWCSCVACWLGWSCSGIHSELDQGRVTSVEQTVMDLAAGPELGEMPQAVMEAVARLSLGPIRSGWNSSSLDITAAPASSGYWLTCAEALKSRRGVAVAESCRIGGVRWSVP